MSVPTTQNLYDFVTKTLLGFEMDETYFLSLLNIARLNRTMARPWKVFQKMDTSQLALPSDDYTVAKTLPSDFLRLTTEGILRVFDNRNKYVVYTEIPYEQYIEFKDVSNNFFVDHNSGKYYLCGKPDQAYTIVMPYIQDSGDLTMTSSWSSRIPSAFHYVLAYDVAAMQRLGADYDDINQRMGDQNAVMAERIFLNMEKWDNELALSSVTQKDYPALSDANPFISGHINRT